MTAAIPVNIWAPVAEIIEAEPLADGPVDVNVDLKCAVRFSALMRRPLVLPRYRVLWLTDIVYDKCGRRRSSATIGSNRRGLPPGNAGKVYPPSPLSDDEMLSLLAVGGSYPAATRDRALIALLWRTGLRISEALDLTLDDLDLPAGTVTVQHGKGDKYRVSGIDPYGVELLGPWLDLLPHYSAGLVYPVVEGPSKGDRMSASSFRTRLHRLAREAGITKRVHPHGLRHSCAVSLNREHVQLPFISRQLGHSNVGITSTYLAGISNVEVVDAIVARDRPVPR